LYDSYLYSEAVVVLRTALQDAIRCEPYLNTCDIGATERKEFCSVGRVQQGTVNGQMMSLATGTLYTVFLSI
jgi:hypothetical protein